MITETAALAAVSAQADVVSPGSVAIGSVSLARYKRELDTIGSRSAPKSGIKPLEALADIRARAFNLRF